jgi:hypothetical protein
MVRTSPLPRVISVLAVLTAVFLAAGCGGGHHKVEGQLVKGGKPFTVSEKGVIQIAFYQEGDKENAALPASFKPDGSFVVNGRDGKGIPPGTYRVSVVALDPYPSGPDLLGGKYTADKTTLKQEIKGGEKITIDVGK